MGKGEGAELGRLREPGMRVYDPPEASEVEPVSTARISYKVFKRCNIELPSMFAAWLCEDIMLAPV